MGPSANPSTYKDNPSVPSSEDTPKSSTSLVVAGEWPEAPNDTVRSTNVILATMDHFRQIGKFRGSLGSLGRNVMVVSRPVGWCCSASDMAESEVM